MIESHASSDSADHSEEIIATLQRASDNGQPVYIKGGNSKRHIAGRDCNYEELDVSGHRGIIDYQPQELVISARGGTPLSDILIALETHDQTLSFEPPLFGGVATVAGTLACNLSGPARPWGGSIRDRVLGVQLINGKGERLNFGGKVMKNVAGYDVSRLQAGAMGTLGIVSEVSLKVVPRSQRSLTLRYQMTAEEAIATMNQRAGEPKPLSGAFWIDGQLYLRLSGAASAVEHTAERWDGETLDDGDEIWEGLREMTLPFFADDAPLWRFSVISTAPPMPELGATLIDWCGSQRWVRGEHSKTELDRMAQAAGGHVTLFRGGDRNAEVRAPMNDVETALQQRLKKSFDPNGILNPGRLYSWL
jgi:glycolate oxidase FAD binding subunit